MKKLQNTQGFTIIETSLVLAIAGLILVMAFVALPALQRQTRDAKRKEDAATFMQALTKYQENNRGQLPALGYITDDLDITNTIDRVGGFNTWATIFDTDPNKRTWAKFYNDYLGNNFASPEGDKYTFMIFNEGIEVTDTYWGDDIYVPYERRAADWYIFMSSSCEDGKPAKSSNKRNVAMLVALESGYYCVDN